MATRAGGAYIEIRGEHKKLQSDLDAAHSKVASTAKKMEHTLNRALKIGGAIALAGITAGMVALTRKVISLGREFEFNMKTVQAWSGATGKELQKLTDIARKMGATTEHTATQAAGALKFLAAAGFTAKQSITALPGTLDLATAGQVDLARATDITTDVLTAFGMEVSELKRVSDAFITTSSSSNTNVLMLGESFKMVAPTANLFGLSVEQTSALLGVLAGSMIKGEMAGSGLNMVLLRSAKAAKMLGLDATTPLIDILKKMKEEQWEATKIGEAFGNRQVKTAVILMKGIEKYEELTRKIIENKGATSKLAAIMRDSLDVDIKTLSSTIEEELLRVFDKYKDDIRETIQATTEWIRQNPQAIEQVAVLAKNMADLVIVMGKVIAIGAEFTNVWIKTWQAMGLASAGIITWSAALTDGANAIDLFSTEIGRLQLRAKFLKDEIVEIQSFKDMMRFYAPGEKDKLVVFQNELIKIEAAIKLIQETASKGLGLEKQINQAERLKKALEDPGAFFGGLSSKETIKQQVKDEKLLAEWSEIQQSYWLTDTENQLRELTIRYENYAKQVDDKIELEKWLASETLQIQGEAANQSVALYQQLYGATGLEEYAEKAIAEYKKVMDAAEVAWGEILDNEEDVAILRLQKEQEFANELYSIFDDIVNAEQDMSNDRLSIIEDFAQDRIAEEERQSWSALEMARDPHMRGVGIPPGITIHVRTPTSIWDAMKVAQQEANIELERIAASTARANQLSTERAQREIQQIYEQRKREVTGQYDRLIDWLIGKQRTEWGMAEWNAQFGRVAEYAAALDPTEAGFYENGLNALENMVDILMQIDRLEEQQLSEQKRLADTLLSSIQTIDDAILSLKAGELSPVTSKEFFTSTYGDMLAAAIESPENIGAFTSFVEQTFLPFMKTYHADTEGYTTVFDNVLAGFEMLKGIYGEEWIGQTLTLAGLYEVDVSDFYTIVGELETMGVDLEDFYMVSGLLLEQGINLNDFYDVSGILQSQGVDLTDFYNVINALESQGIDLEDFYDISGVLSEQGVDLEKFYQVINTLESQGVDLEDFYDIVGTLQKQEVNLNDFYDVIGTLDATTVDWAQLVDFDFQELADLMNTPFADIEMTGMQTAVSKLQEFIGVLGLVPDTAQLIIDKMKAGSTFETAFKDTVGYLGSLENPLTGVGTTSDWTASSASGLTSELAATLTPFNALSLNLDAMSQNVQNKTAEVADFFTVLANSLGLTFTGEGGIAEAIWSLTPTPISPTAVGTMETSPYVPSQGRWEYTGYGNQTAWVIYQQAIPAHGFILMSDGSKTAYGAGGYTDGIGIAGELGRELIIPQYEPQKSTFLKDVGVDPEEIGMAMAKHLVPLVMQNNEQGGKDLTINIIVDGQVINSVVKKGLAGEDTDLIEMVRAA